MTKSEEQAWDILEKLDRDMGLSFKIEIGVFGFRVTFTDQNISATNTDFLLAVQECQEKMK